MFNLKKDKNNFLIYNFLTLVLFSLSLKNITKINYKNLQIDV